MKTIEINIEKADMNSFSVSHSDHKFLPAISATINLRTAEGKKVSDFFISTDSYNEDNKFNPPPEIFDHIANIEKMLEVEAVRHCMSSLKLLPKPKENTNE